MVDRDQPISRVLRRHAAERPDDIACTFLADGEREEVSLSFSGLAARADAVAALIRDRAPEAARALLMVPPGVDFVACLSGCLAAGVAAIPVPLPSARAASRSSLRFAGLLADARPDVILTIPTQLARVRLAVQSGSALPDRAIIATDGTDIDAATPADEPAMPDLALIQYTSGSTARPKGVVISFANLSANLAAISERFRLDAGSVVVSWLPPHHDMGLIGGVLAGLWSGHRTILMDPRHFLQRPLRWLEAIDRFGADVSGGANFAYDLCAAAGDRTEVAGLDLSRWRLAFSGAEPVRASTIDRFTRAFAGNGFRREAFYPCYGLAEATLIATGAAPGSERPIVRPFDTASLAAGRAVAGDGSDVRHLVGCGTPCPETEIRIVHPEDRHCLGDGEIGEIWISGPAIAEGYRDADSNGVQDLREALSGETDAPYHATGDLGFLLDGELFVTGRLKDLIIVRGRNFVPADIEEAAASSHPALVMDAVAAFGVDTGFDEAVVVACEVRRDARRGLDHAEVRSSVRSAVATQCGVTIAEVLLLRPGSLVRTTSGKLMRHACRDAWRDGLWQELAPSATAATGEGAASDDLLERLRILVATLAGVSPVFVDKERSLEEAGLDSLKFVELLLHLEQTWGVHPGTDAIDLSITLVELARKVEAHRAGTPADVSGVSCPPENPDCLPLTPRQETFLSAGLKDPAAFCETLMIRVPAGTDVRVLAAAIDRTCRRYAVFSHRFRHDGKAWRQEVSADPGDFPLETVDASGLAGPAVARLRDDIIRRMKSEIDLAAGPLARFCLINRGEGEAGVLAGTFHHLVIDAVSLSIWVLQFQRCHDAMIDGKSPDTLVTDTGFASWLGDLDQYARGSEVLGETDYWRQVCGTRAEPQPWRTEPGASRSKQGWRNAGVRHLSPAANTRLLQRYTSGGERCGLVLAALAAAWQELAGEPSLLVSIEGHGRTRLGATDPMIAVGWMACEFPVRISVTEATSPAGPVSAAIAALKAVPSGGHGYALLAGGSAGDAVAGRMAELARPVVGLQYRGNVDETFRHRSRLPVLGVIHDTGVWQELASGPDQSMRLRFQARLDGNVLRWSAVAAAEVPDAFCASMLDGMARFLERLAVTSGEEPESGDRQQHGDGGKRQDRPPGQEGIGNV
jgi:acyl-CoA synthetase (AMP-forming)/AMP-acid ligase II/acyl carrier protein